MPDSQVAGVVPVRQLFLLPDAVPAARTVQRWGQTHWQIGGAYWHIEERQPAPLGARQARTALSEALSRIATGAWISVGHGEPGDDAHDKYFRIQRVNADPAPAFLQMLLGARLLLLQEGTRYASESTQPILAAMDRPLARLIAALLPERGEIAMPVTDWEFPAQPMHSPLLRWIIGHQIFAAITQALMLTMDSMRAGIRAGSLHDVREAAEGARLLLRATSAAFAFTADFAPGEYESLIRPTMAPPYTAVSLSGLMSADHRALVQQMRDMRPAFRALADHEPALHQALAQALAQVYDQHILVCQRFVGNQPSLLVAGKSEKTGPQVLEQFKTLRQKSFDYQPKAGPPTLAPAPARCPMREQIKHTFYAARRHNSD